MKDAEIKKIYEFFKKYLPIWQKASKIRGGKVILHFDENGEIRKAEFITQYPIKKLSTGKGLDNDLG